MEAHSRMRLGREAPVNSFLLCTVLARQTRRLGRLMPDRGIPELITIALKNCADYELALELGPGVPEVVRDKAMQIGRITRRAEPSVASSPGHWEGSRFADAVSAAARVAGDREPAGEALLPGESSMGAHLLVGSSVDASDFRRDLRSPRWEDLQPRSAVQPARSSSSYMASSRSTVWMACSCAP